MERQEPRRFIRTETEFGKERAEAVRLAFEEIQATYPEVLSVMLYGSLVKGSSRPESDIDATIFVDSSMIAEDGQEPYEAIYDDIGTINSIAKKELKLWLTDGLSTFYVEKLRSALQRNLPELNDEQVEHIKSLPISDAIVDRITGEMSASYKAAQQAEIEFTKLREEHPDATHEELIKMMKTLPKEFIVEKLTTRTMFHLSVGQGIRKYRHRFLRNLKAQGPTGEAVWKAVVDHLERWEQKVEYEDLPTPVRYPRTLDEAITLYG